MLKLSFIAILGSFIIYGLDEMQIISASNFEQVEEPSVSSTAVDHTNQQNTLTKVGSSSEKFTDRVVRLNKQRQEG